MKTKGRFIASIIAAAETDAVQMPWARGKRRAEMIARRTQATPANKARSA